MSEQLTNDPRVLRSYPMIGKPDRWSGGSDRPCFLVTVAGLQGCVGYAETMDAAFESAEQSKRAYITHLINHGEPIPEPPPLHRAFLESWTS